MFADRTPLRRFGSLEALEPRQLLAAAFALTTSNHLLSFDTSDPATITSTKTITNLQPGESILAIDVRPATGQLYGLGSTSRLYRINPKTGAAAQVGGVFAVPLSGDSFDLDFNPAVDRIRVVSNDDLNFRLNPDTGAVVDGDLVAPGIQPDGDLDFDAGDPNAAADPIVVGAAYSNNFLGTSSTTLSTIDSGLNALLTQGSPGGIPTSPNTGALFTVGSLGIDVSKRLGFDIVSANGTDAAFGVFQVVGQVRPSVYSVNLSTGAASPIARIGTRKKIADVAIAPAQINVLGLSANNELLGFNAADPGSVSRRIKIKGVQKNESILAIDFRPATEQLFGLGSTSRLYRINPLTGTATQVGPQFAVPLNGTSFGFDFNPVPDRIRVTSDTNQNFRLNPDTGAVVDADPVTPGIQIDGDLAYASGDPNAGTDPVVVGSAYSRNFPGTISTTLFNIDSGLDVLVTQGSPAGAPTSPNTGQLFTVGALGVDATNQVGFDITSNEGIEKALAVIQVEGASTSSLFAINLLSGAAIKVGDLGGGKLFSDIAIVPS